jgi:ATP-dependent protease HslVU (ClpYQ) peptidase subunit
MSVIFGAIVDGKLAIGCDSKSSEGNLLFPAGEKLTWQKIHKFGNAYVGHVGNSQYHTVLENLASNHLDLFDFSNQISIHQSFNRAQKLLVQEYGLVPQGDDFAGSGLNLLIAANNKLYTVDPERGVDEYQRFWAVGSGSMFALGAAEALYDKADTAKTLVHEVIRVVCKYDLHSLEPIYVAE